MNTNDNLVDIHLSDDGLLTFVCPHILDSVNASQAKELCVNALSDQVLEVQINLTDTTFMDSAGIGVLVTLYRLVKEKNLPISQVGTTGQPLSLVQSLQIDKVIPLI